MARFHSRRILPPEPGKGTRTQEWTVRNGLIERLLPMPRSVAVVGGCMKMPRRLALAVRPEVQELVKWLD